MTKVSKITISLPVETFDAVEREREIKGESRSAFLVRAVEEHLRRERERRWDEEYVRGYQTFPEAEEERAWAEYGLKALAEVYRDEEPWPEEQEREGDRQETHR